MYGVVVILLSMLVGLVAGVGIASTGGHTQGNMTLTILTWIDTVLVGAISATGVTAIYYELRTVKEGMAPEQLAAAFD